MLYSHPLLYLSSFAFTCISCGKAWNEAKGTCTCNVYNIKQDNVQYCTLNELYCMWGIVQSARLLNSGELYRSRPELHPLFKVVGGAQICDRHVTTLHSQLRNGAFAVRAAYVIVCLPKASRSH